MLDAVVAGRWGEALKALDDFEELASLYLVFRGNGSSLEHFRDICYRLRLYLSERKRRFVVEQLQNLWKMFSSAAPENPFQALAAIYADLREDWLEFWGSPSDETLRPIVDDLERLDSLERFFREEGEAVYKQYRKVLEARGRCFVHMPVLSAVAKGLSGKEETKQRLHEDFSNLFAEIERLLAPYMMEEEKEEEVKKLRVVED